MMTFITKTTLLTAILCVAGAVQSSHEAIKDDGRLIHPGALHSAEDISRVKSYVEAEREPWSLAYEHLTKSSLAQSSYAPVPQTVLIRGTNSTYPNEENYSHAMRDAHAAYQLSLRWLISGDTTYADTAVTILDAWGQQLKDINGTEDKYLAAGLYGYQFTNAAELLREYSGWSRKSQDDFGHMLNAVFAKYNLDFLENHAYKTSFYYANWDLCNIASMMSIGIFNDNKTMYDYAVNYWKNGIPGKPEVVANGALPYFSIANFTEGGTGKTLMEIQESGRDQGHATLCIALLGVIGQQGWNQGIDLYSTFGNEILNAAEYIAKYNVNETVPYESYISWEGNLTVISSKDRATVRPGFEAVYGHYADLKGQDAYWTGQYRDYVNSRSSDGIEGGGGDYGPNSGGFDAFGYGTLMYRLK